MTSRSCCRWACVALLIALGGCTTGEGQGEVTSERLFVPDCWNGPFDLQPTFYGANPYRERTLFIRVQRGDDSVDVSDGLTVSIGDIESVRALRGESVRVGLPAGVSPTGVATLPNATPAPVSMGLYLHATCNRQNGVVYAVDGSITFDSLFSGDPNELEASERLTEAYFDAEFADPRTLGATPGSSSDVVSNVKGWFRFFFQRGPPAQPFP